MAAHVLVKGTGFMKVSGSGFATAYSPPPPAYTYSIKAWGAAASITGFAGVDISLGSPLAMKSNIGAYAAIKTDGSIVTWGNAAFGGTYSVPTTPNSGYASLAVANIFNAGYGYSMAALKTDGSVGIWGNIGNVYYNTKTITKIVGEDETFTGLASDGTVVSWGSYPFVGTNSNIVDILGLGLMSVSINSTNKLFIYGNASWGGDGATPNGFWRNGVTWTATNTTNGGSAKVLANSTIQVIQSAGSVSALLTDGSVVSWYGASGLNLAGTQSNKTGDLSSGVLSIYGTRSTVGGVDGFAALKSDGSVVVWGNTTRGQNITAVSAALSSGVLAVYDNNIGFVAMKAGGNIVSWGLQPFAGTNGNFTKIVFSTDAWAGLKSDGSVLAWGASSHGGSLTTPVNVSASLTSGVTDIIGNASSFSAIKSDGSVISWGNQTNGGNSTGASLTNVLSITEGSNSYSAVIQTPT